MTFAICQKIHTKFGDTTNLFSVFLAIFVSPLTYLIVKQEMDNRNDIYWNTAVVKKGAL